MNDTYTIQDLFKIRINPIPLIPKYRAILGNIPKDEQWTMMIFGYSQSGKSSFALKISDILSRFGRVLYNAAEEKVNTGTITERMRRMGVYSTSVDIFQNREISNLRAMLDTGRYKYCVVDSANRLSMTIPELLEIFNLQKEYPKVSFIFISHGNKEMKNYIGPAALQNMVDVAIEMDHGNVKIAKNYYATSNNKDPKFNIFNN